jgi:hypothetical protein
MQELIDMYNKQVQQEKFAALVAARVGDLLDGTAKELNFKPTGGTMYTHAEETLMNADVIARSVVNYLAIRNSKPID